jgi:hypothetical protein
MAQRHSSHHKKVKVLEKNGTRMAAACFLRDGNPFLNSLKKHSGRLQTTINEIVFMLLETGF